MIGSDTSNTRRMGLRLNDTAWGAQHKQVVYQIIFTVGRMFMLSEKNDNISVRGVKCSILLSRFRITIDMIALLYILQLYGFLNLGGHAQFGSVH